MNPEYDFNSSSKELALSSVSSQTVASVTYDGLSSEELIDGVWEVADEFGIPVGELIVKGRMLKLRALGQ